MRFGLGFAAVAAVACSEGGVKSVNATPEAYITSHATGDTVREADTETVLGQVADANHALDELSVTWLYNSEVVCPDSAPDAAGSVRCDVTFSTDGGDVALTVRDPGGETATARVTFEVQATDAPTASIAAPTADGVYYSDQSIAFQGTVADAEDAAEDLAVRFETDAVGDLGLDVTVTSEGAVEAFGTLDEGEHAVRLVVTDTSGKEGIDSALITVGPPNSAPTCSITAPADLSAGSEGELVIFSATVADADIPANLLAVDWSSDKDGPLGTSTPDSAGAVSFPYEDLSVNTHVITLTATDEMGANCVANVIYSVGTPPVLTVTAPTDGATLNHSDAVVFEATVEDNEDLPTAIGLSWESDLDGVFSTDGADSSGAVTVSVATLSPGDHVVTVTATDTDGLFVTDTVSFNLNQPPTTPTVTLEPDPAATNQMLVATASGSEDPEGTGTVTYAYEWFEDGVATAESASATFPASATGKNHTYRVQVTASDGLVESAFGYAEVNVINSVPALVGPSLSAATVTVGDVLTCTATATDIDPEDSPALTYAWHDGSTGPSYTVTMADAVDSTITCTATADDADGGVVTGTASATVTNTAPTVDTVTVTPATGQVGDVLTCAATASDADGTAPDIAYAWSDGSTGTAYTITADDAVDSTITCTATASDAYESATEDTATATVTNSAPTVDTVSVTPTEAKVGDVLTCLATASDPDARTPTVTYAWSDGSTSSSYTVATTDDPGDVITCTATATDVYGQTGSAFETATVINTNPTVTSVTITPNPAYNDDTLACNATAIDADGGTTTIAYEWTGGATGHELPLTSIIAASGDTLTCTAIATDDDLATATGTDSITLSNRSPTAAATIMPESATVYSTLSCTAADANDPDDDATTTSFAWTIDGVDAVAASSADESTLETSVEAGQTVVCTVTVTDGKGGIGTSSTTRTIRNTAPVVSDVTLSPAAVYTNDTITASATVTDAEGDELDITYRFFVGVDMVQEGPINTLDGTVHFSKGDEIYVAVKADDGIVTHTEASSKITVLNTPPVAPEISISLNECAGLYFDGSDYLEWTDEQLFTDSGNATIEAWVQPTHDDDDSTATGRYPILSNHRGGGAESFPEMGGSGMSFELQAGDNKQLWFEMDGAWTGSDTDLWSDSEWHHIAIVFNRGTIQFLFDGEDAGFRTTNERGHALPSVFPLRMEGVPYRIGGKGGLGASPWGLSPLKFVGNMRDVRVWESARTREEITANMHGLTDEEAGSSDLIAHWKMNDASGSTSVDSAGGDHDMTTIGTEWISDLEEGCGLVCSIDEEATESDGDPITYTFDWDVDGEAYTDTETTAYDGDTVPLETLGIDEDWYCSVTASDDESTATSDAANYAIACELGTSEYCAAESCLAILDENPFARTGRYWVDFGADAIFKTICDMDREGGGWTLVARGYDEEVPGSMWLNNDAFNTGSASSTATSFHASDTQIDTVASSNEMLIDCGNTTPHFLITGMGAFTWEAQTSSSECIDDTGASYGTVWDATHHQGPSCVGAMTLGHRHDGRNPWFCRGFATDIRGWAR